MVEDYYPSEPILEKEVQVIPYFVKIRVMAYPDILDENDKGELVPKHDFSNLPRIQPEEHDALFRGRPLNN